MSCLSIDILGFAWPRFSLQFWYVLKTNESNVLIYSVGQSASNIALHKPAFQQNAFISDPIDPNEDSFDAGNAVDGLKSDLSGLGGQCSLCQ